MAAEAGEESVEVLAFGAAVGDGVGAFVGAPEGVGLAVEAVVDVVGHVDVVWLAEDLEGVSADAGVDDVGVDPEALDEEEFLEDAGDGVVVVGDASGGGAEEAVGVVEGVGLAVGAEVVVEHELGGVGEGGFGFVLVGVVGGEVEELVDLGEGGVVGGGVGVGVAGSVEGVSAGAAGGGVCGEASAGVLEGGSVGRFVVGVEEFGDDLVGELVLEGFEDGVPAVAEDLAAGDRDEAAGGVPGAPAAFVVVEADGGGSEGGAEELVVEVGPGVGEGAEAAALEWLGEALGGHGLVVEVAVGVPEVGVELGAAICGVCGVHEEGGVWVGGGGSR